MTALLQSPKRLAKLLASVNVSGSERPLSPVEVAVEIDSMLAELGGDRAQLLERLPLSGDMVDSFSRLLRLPPQIHGIIVWGSPDPGTGQISFTAAQELGKLDRPEDILMFVNASHEASKPLTKNEIGAMVSLRRSHPEKTAEDCIAEVTNVTRPLVTHHYIFISGIGTAAIRSLNAPAGGKGPDERALAALTEAFPPGSVTGAKIGKDHARITLSREGSEFIQVYADRNSIPKKDVVDHIILKSG